MAESPSLELQGYIVATLKANAGVASFCAGRIYDRVPEHREFPFITIGPMQEINDHPDCIDGCEVSIQLDAWSRAVGYPEVKRIDAAVHAALYDRNVALPVNACSYLNHTNTLFLRDPDGLTNHAVIQLEAYVERTP